MLKTPTTTAVQQGERRRGREKKPKFNPPANIWLLTLPLLCQCSFVWRIKDESGKHKSRNHQVRGKRHTHTHTHTHTHKHTCIHTRTHARTHTYTHTYTHMRIHILTYREQAYKPVWPHPFMLTHLLQTGTKLNAQHTKLSITSKAQFQTKPIHARALMIRMKNCPKCCNIEGDLHRKFYAKASHALRNLPISTLVCPNTLCMYSGTTITTCSHPFMFIQNQGSKLKLMLWYSHTFACIAANCMSYTTSRLWVSEVLFRHPSHNFAIFMQVCVRLRSYFFAALLLFAVPVQSGGARAQGVLKTRQEGLRSHAAGMCLCVHVHMCVCV